jgi:predicted permease
VISDTLWRNVLGADPGVVGKSLRLNRQPFLVVGVAPPGFAGVEVVKSTFWVPVAAQETLIAGRELLTDENMSWLMVIGRLRGGASLEAARADLGVTAALRDKSYPGRRTSIIATPATFLASPAERSIVMTVGQIVLVAVAMVLLIACANIANLLLARAAGRQKEIAVRLSIGASRGRIIRQFLTESLLLSAIGGTLGTILSWLTFSALADFVVRCLPADVPPLAIRAGIDGRFLLYALAATMFTGMVCGLAPAMQASRASINTALKSGGESKHGGGRLRRFLVGAQLTVCMVLLIAAGLLLHGLYRAQFVEPGFEMDGVALASFNLRGEGYRNDRAAAFLDQLEDRLRALPGVESVAECRVPPLNDSHMQSDFTIPGEKNLRMLRMNYVSPEFFPTLRIPIVRGRNFTPREARTGAPALIVTEAAARSLWPGQDPIGKTLRLGSDADLEVVGVVADAQVDRIGVGHPEFVYLLAGPRARQEVHLLVRIRSDRTSTFDGIRAAIREQDPEMVVKVAPFEDNLEAFRQPARIVAGLSGALGGLALILAVIGVYGMVAYSISQCVREIGIRMALGAGRDDVARLVLRQGMLPVAWGALLGLTCAVGASRILSSMLFGVSPVDPVSFTLVPFFLLCVAALATYIPARRAMRVDPVVALRYE